MLPYEKVIIPYRFGIQKTPSVKSLSWMAMSLDRAGVTACSFFAEILHDIKVTWAEKLDKN